MEYLIKKSDKTAIFSGELTISYSQTLAQISLLSSKLNIKQGDRIGIFSENRPEWLFGVYAIWKKDGILVPIDYLSNAKDVAYILNDCKPSTIICSPDRKEVLAEAILLSNFIPDILIIEDYSPTLEEDSIQSIPFPKPENTAIILYTSGTTGSPKGVMLSFKNIFMNLNAVCNDVKIYQENETVMILLPLHHIFPLVGTIVAPFYAGASIAISPSFASEDIMKTMNEHGVSIMIGVPRLYSLIYKGLHDKISQSKVASLLFFLAAKVNSLAFSQKVFGMVHKKFGGKIKYMVCGGAPLDKKVASYYKTLGFQLLEGFGMTETAPMITFSRPGKVVPGSPGQAVEGCEIEIRDNELIVRGDNVMQGYYNKPDETAMVIKDGWLYTGDLGYLDAKGYLFITGRKKEIIILPNGKNINPEELEKEFLTYSSAIKECAIFTHEDILQTIVFPDFKILNQLGVQNTEDYFKWEVLDKFNQQVTPFKKIFKITLVAEELPKTRLGKLRRYELPKLIKDKNKPKVAIEEPKFHEYIALKTFLESETGKMILPTDHIEMDLSLDSLGRVGLSAFIQTAFGIEIAENDLSNYVSVEKLAEYVQNKKTKSDVEQISWAQILKERVNLKLPNTWFTFNLLKNISATVLKTFLRVRGKGIQNLPNTPCIIAPNHQSYLDGFIVASFLKREMMRKTYFYAKEKHFKQRWLKFIANRNNIILIDINKNLKDSLQKLAEVLRSGKNIIIFPEGTRSLNGELGDFKQTFAILSQELNVPVVPVSINGSYDILPSGRHFPRLFKKVNVEFLQPVYPANHTYDSLRNQVKDNLKQNMETYR